MLSALGAGGMGEVYRARDSRLERDVAIKILPQHLSSSAQFRERFEREAKAISQLNHPHICTLHDVGHENGTSYLVMELLEGESLADRLSKGPMPIEQVLRYGTQIAAALDRAHRHGIVHRDLKPGNIMIAKSGAKLLDFGLAKSAAPAPVAAFSVATEQKPLTSEGMILGTYQYMAPEQLEGLEADARTDIFALGAVLYEMATGQRAFAGKTKTSLIAAIVSSAPPPISRVQPVTPAAFEHVVAKCLEKDPDDRWQSAHDIAQELEWIARSNGDEVRAAGAGGRTRALGWIAAALAGLIFGAGGVWLLGRPAAPRAPVVRFTVPLPPNAPLVYGSHVAMAISPDGSRIVYRAKNGEKTQLYMRTIGQLQPRPLPGTENASVGRFSPDGRSVLLTSERKLKKLQLDGGLPVPLTESRQANLGTHWFGDTIYYAESFTGGILAIPAAGGKPRVVVKPDAARGRRAILWPNVLPGGKTLIATVWNNGAWDEAKIMAFPIGGGEPKTVIDGGSCAMYVRTGHLLFHRGGTLFAVPFDPESLAVTGAAVPVVNGVASGSNNGEVHYAVSDSGTLVYAQGGVVSVRRSLLWVDRKGNESPVVPTMRTYGEARISPDGRSIAVTLEAATFDIWLLDIERDSISRLSFGGDDFDPQWTRDGRRVIWTSSRDGKYNLHWAPADGSGGEERFSASPFDRYPRDMSADGTLLLATDDPAGTGSGDIVVIPLAGDRKPRPVVATRFTESGGVFSPDGKWIAYVSDESGRFEVYLRPFPGPGGKWQVSVGGAEGVLFAKTGREIFYAIGDKVYAVPVSLEGQVRIGRPQLLFEKELRGITDLDGNEPRFLAVRDVTPPTGSELHVVLNWFEDLRQRAGAG